MTFSPSVVEAIKKNPKLTAGKIDITLLENIISHAKYLYYNTAQRLMDDDTYDIIETVLQKRSPNSKVLQDVGADVGDEKVKLPFYLGSQDKIKFGSEEKKLDRWKKKYSGPYLIGDKLDGMSALIHVVKGKAYFYTRGNGTHGHDITRLLPYINLFSGKKHTLTELNKQEGIGIRGELLIKKKTFQKYAGQYNHSRNFVTGIKNSKELKPEILKDIDFVAYQMISHQHLDLETQYKTIQNLGINLVDYSIINTLDKDQLSVYFGNRRKDSQYDVDGIVITDNNPHQVVNGRKCPKYSFAFKMIIDNQVGISKVTKMEWNISKDGYLIPRITIEPLQLAGATITHATCHHADFVVKNKIGVGATVKIVRSGDIIPYILEVLKPAKESGLPEEGTYVWNSTNTDIIIKNKDNPALRKKLIFHFFSNLGVKNVSEGILTKMIDANFDTIKKILTINKQQLLELEGIKETMANKILSAFQTSIQKLELLTLMVGSNKFGRNLGYKKLRLFLNVYPNFINSYQQKEITVEKLNQIEGFSQKTSQKLINNIPNFILFLEKEIPPFITKMVLLKSKNKKKSIKKKKGKFLGMNIVLTGTRNFEDYIKDNGGKIQGNVNSKTNLLICKDKSSNSSKIKKAKSLNIPVLDLQDFKKKYIETGNIIYIKKKKKK